MSYNNLELGDIIKIASSSNSDINDKIFFINYIDKDKCKLINVKNKDEIILNITENEFDDKSIEGIKILTFGQGEQCCGFGGTFSVSYPYISKKVGDLKIEHVF